MKNILVTGGAGYVGSHIVELLVKKNLIYKHIDYWDSGKNFYSNLPLVGSIFRKIHY